MGEEKKLGADLQAARQNKGLTQQQLCEKADLSYSTLTKIERGAIKAPSIFTVASLARELDLSLDALVGSVDSKHGSEDSLGAYGGAQNNLRTSKTGVKFLYMDINGCLVQFFQDAFLQIATDFGLSAGRVEAAFWRLNEDANRGEISSEQLNQQLSKSLGTDKIIDWNEYYLSAIKPIPEMIELLNWASKNYRVGLLSNINQGVIKQLLAKNILPAINYSSIIDSSEIGLIKPQKQIFELAVQKSGVQAEEILLVDDNRDNIMSAQEVGIQVCWFDGFDPQESAQKIRALLEF